MNNHIINELEDDLYSAIKDWVEVPDWGCPICHYCKRDVVIDESDVFHCQHDNDCLITKYQWLIDFHSKDL